MSISYNPFTNSHTHTSRICNIHTHLPWFHVNCQFLTESPSLMSAAQEERQQRLQEIEENRQDRMSRRRQQRFHQTQNFYKSLQLLQAGKLLREGADGAAEGVAEDGTPFEDYSIFLYRQQAPIFNDRVKELERKLLFPVSNQDRSDLVPFKLPGCLSTQMLHAASSFSPYFFCRLPLVVHSPNNVKFQFNP